MDAAQDMQKLNPDRQRKLCAAFNHRSVEELMSLYSDKDIEFSDFGTGTLNLDKKGLHTYITKLFAATQDVQITTITMSGTKDFTTWEWNLIVKFKGDPESGKEGVIKKMVGVSVTWWDGEGKIVRNHDYAKPVEDFGTRRGLAA